MIRGVLMISGGAVVGAVATAIGAWVYRVTDPSRWRFWQ